MAATRRLRSRALTALKIDLLAPPSRAQALRQLGEARIGANDRAGAIDGRNRHRRMVEEAHEAHFGRALRIGAFVARAADDERARGAGRAVGAESELVIEPSRHGLAGAHAQVDIENFGRHLARRRRNRGQKRSAIAGHDVGQLQPARSDLGQIVVEPVGERRIDIGDLAGGVDREETARRVIEIFDRVLQLLEHVLLPLAVAGDIGDRPHRVFRLALALAERTHPHPEPAAVGAVGAGKTNLFLLALAFARRLQQPEHRLRHVGIADEDALDRANVLRRRRARQRQIGGIGIDDMAARVGDGDPVISEIGDAADDGVVGRTVGKADDAGGKGKQIEQADHGKQRQQAENIRLGLRAADGGQRDRTATMAPATKSTSRMLPPRRTGSWAAAGGRAADNGRVRRSCTLRIATGRTEIAHS